MWFHPLLFGPVNTKRCTGRSAINLKGMVVRVMGVVLVACVDGVLVVLTDFEGVRCITLVYIGTYSFYAPFMEWSFARPYYFVEGNELVLARGGRFLVFPPP